jgi:tape measure domain-containing protein
MGGWKAGVQGVIGKYQHLRQAVKDVTAVAVASAAAPAMYEDMTDSIKAVTGSAEEAVQAMDLIGGISEKQKFEFEPLVEAYEHMRALGYSAQQTRDFVTEMANALQAAGGDASDLTAVVGALSKIKDKGELSAKALHAMGETMPFLRTIMKEQFGSETAADIEKLGLSSEELFEGIMRGLKQVENQEGSNKEAWDPAYMASAARFEYGRRMQFESAGQTLKPVPDLPERTAAPADPAGDAARIAEMRAREANRKAAEEAEKKAKTQAEGLETLEAEAAVSAKKVELEQALADKDKDRQEALELELAMLTEGKEIMEKTGLAAEVVQKYLDKRLSRERDIARIKEEAGHGEFAAKAGEDMEVARLRSRGKNKQADKLEADRAEKQRVEQLMKEGGMSESAAEKMAAGERQIQEDTDYLSRTGRRKMRGATNGRSFTGLDDYHQSDRLMGMSDEWNFDKLDAAKADRKNRPLKSQLDREAGKPSITPDKFSGMTIKQADELIKEMRGMRADIQANGPTVAEKTQPRN